MSEEVETVELDTDIVKRTLVDAQSNNAELDIKTPYIVREVQVTQRQRIPLYTNGTLKIAGQTTGAAPTGQGLTDKQTLIDRGWTVTTD